jgi:hypothetical protein
LKYIIITALCCLIAILGCRHETDIPKPDLKKLLQQSLVDDYFKWRVGIKSNQAQRFYVYFDQDVKDSVWIQGNLFLINEKSAKVDSGKMIMVKLDSIDRTARLLKLEHIYYPSMTTKIISDFQFNFELGKWNGKRAYAAIADGHFKF